MKILHVIPTIDPKQGGMAQALKTMTVGPTVQHVENEVVCLDDPTKDFWLDTNVAVHSLGIATGRWNFNKQLIPWLLVNLIRFDVVIVHGLWVYPGVAVRKALVLLLENGIQVPKLFVMPHGMLDPYFQFAPDRKLKAIRNTIYWKLVEHKLIERAEGLLFTCQEELALSQIPFKPYKPKLNFVVGLGVESPPSFSKEMRESFEKKSPGLNGSPYLLFLSRIHKKKGVDLLILAYAKALREDGNLPKLVIAGPGLDTPYGRKMQHLVISDQLLRNAVVFSGMLTGDAKWGAFYGCEAFILPSHQENFGIAVVEALGCGKPVLISNQINIWKEINQAGACYVAENTIEGTSILLKLWSRASPQQKFVMSRNALHAFQKNFSTTQASKMLYNAIN
ncbi:glycosyltransferase [Pedobacter sp.]|uniref:glycosyltransferase n=1 Tax=Pedobacter sp. TaxID=1411316 RepID=UPI003D7FA02D